ncbi:hypothetical protein [Gilvimarinus sp. DA14]|uniref:hypothetical protein n=1 Tax=Gilvimarinus sp. DA14 TaxID=2956798 RepID=UPI0020B8A7E0|nr:hypothetical protein [Gilvimarinus sp. DA14]UTF60719.1 hypothetical protein NHM04_02655 [Gilvimarinus sp. DA14]
MSSQAINVEAVIVFDEGKIDRELQYPEFEAIMDGFVPIPEFAHRQMSAVYLRINPSLRITACVFFLAEFEAGGMIAKRWNVPLQALADNAARGPDLGAGPIALACYSQCPIDWQKTKLWDPVMEPGRNSFVLMKKAIAANRLGLVFPRSEREAETESAPDQQNLRANLEREFATTMRTRLAHTLKEQRLRINTLKNRMALKLDGLKREHQIRLDNYQQRLDHADEAVKHASSRIQELEHELALKDGKIEGLREYYEHKLRALQQDGGAEIEALEAGFAEQLQAKLEESTEHMQQLLDMREMELFYRQQQEESLREELAVLQRERDSLLNHGAVQLLAPMKKAGISFVVFAPGCGQLTLSADEVPDYMADPVAFAAERTGLSLQSYKLWLDHHHSPYCTAVNSDGEECGQGVKRVLEPADFHDGESNRCEHHRSQNSNYVAGRS